MGLEEEIMSVARDLGIDKVGFTFLLTCGSCMLICRPDIEDKEEDSSLLTTSGRVIKDETGIRVVRASCTVS